MTKFMSVLLAALMLTFVVLPASANESHLAFHSAAPLHLSVTIVAPNSTPRNLPPVAVNDEVIVYGYTDYLEIPVFANDYDPEGQPIAVIALETIDLGKAVLLKGGAIGVTPDWSVADGDDSTGPVLIAHGSYLISDGQLSGKGQWFVWH